MAYTIKRTDGTILLTLSDSRVDQLTTSLALIGKNVDSWGTYYNDNLVGILENFAGLNEPRSPIIGQLWYNKVDGRMYVYGMDNVFKPVTGAQVANVPPTIANQGDFWIDATNKQLYFTTDGANFTLAGPQYSQVSGKAGWLVETITDVTKTPQIVASLYNNNALLGIVSSQAFTFDVPQGGMSSVVTGFNLNQSIPGIRFVGTATSADSVQGFTPADYLKNTGNQVLAGGLRINSNNPGLQVGSNQEIQITVEPTFTNIIHGITNKSLRIQGSSTSNPGSISSVFTAITVDAANKRVGIFTPDNTGPQYPMDIIGDTRIQGNLIVVGTSTNVQSVNLQVNDKNIQLAYGQGTPSDSFASGGGITLIGSTDHTITWVNNGSGWNFNTNVNLTSTASSYLIGGTPILNSTSLGTSITDARGIRRLGILDSLTVTNVLIHDNVVQATGTNVTLRLSGVGSGTVDTSGNRVSSVATPIFDTDAANKKYVDDSVLLVGSKGFTISIDVTNMADPATEIIPYLNKLIPIVNPGAAYLDLPAGVRVRALCSVISYSIPASPIQNVTLTPSTVQVNDIYGNPTTVISAIGGVIPSSTVIIPTINYTVREFVVNNSLVWQFNGIV
jgi:hypothetical protein